MKKQRLLKTIVLGLMAMVGVNAWADGNVAKIGSTEYATLKDAVDALSADGQTIELLADATWTSRMNKDKKYSVTIQPASGLWCQPRGNTCRRQHSQRSCSDAD